jgi:hypothetical protein
MFRKWGSVVAATALIASSTMAFAGTDTQNKGALAPGKAAGVQKAETWGTNSTMLLVGGALIVGGLALTLSDNGGHSHVSTTTTGTP